MDARSAKLASKLCRERDLVLAMVASRIVAPHAKLATTRWWHTTTLAEDFGVADAKEDDLYAAMDWLLARQDTIQKKLAARHLSEGALVQLGYSRDGRRGLLQVNYGLLTDARGCPVAVSVHEGNVPDSQTLMPEVKRLREEFGVELQQGHRGTARGPTASPWITALTKSVSIRALSEQGQLQLDLFDQRNLLELRSPDYPGERLVACLNLELAKLRTHKRQELLAATEHNLDKIKARVEAGKLVG